MSKYEPIPPEDGSQALPPPPAKSFPRQCILWIFHAACFLLSLSMLATSYRRDTHVCQCPHDDRFIYSSAQSAVEYIKQEFQGVFNLKSVYKGILSKELDDAWDALSPSSILPGPTLSVSQEELDLIGITLALWAT